jgi:hypothetical protein
MSAGLNLRDVLRVESVALTVRIEETAAREASQSWKQLNCLTGLCKYNKMKPMIFEEKF